MLDLYSDEYFMREALKEAKLALASGEVPVGAVVVCNNTIIGKGHNQTELLTDVTAHAEMLAITAASNYLASKYLKECTLYVTLEPCVMCAGALQWSQIGKVVFGASDEKRGFNLLKAPILHPKTLVTNGILSSECKKILQDFFLNLRDK